MKERLNGWPVKEAIKLSLLKLWRMVVSRPSLKGKPDARGFRRLKFSKKRPSRAVTAIDWPGRSGAVKDLSYEIEISICLPIWINPEISYIDDEGIGQSYHAE